METGIKSSFIPQTPIEPVRASRHSSGGGSDVLTLLSLVVFVASVTLGAAVFLYAQFLNTSSANKRASLERANEAFEPSLIQDLTRLDDRMRASDVILHAHVAPSKLFRLLEQITLQTVSYTSFDFLENTDGIEITMQGVAQSVNSIALQADLLSKSGAIANPIFSNINRQAGGVRFDFTADVRPDAILYKDAPVVEAAQPGIPEPISPFGAPEGTPTPVPPQPQN